MVDSGGHQRLAISPRDVVQPSYVQLQHTRTRKSVKEETRSHQTHWGWGGGGGGGKEMVYCAHREITLLCM